MSSAVEHTARSILQQRIAAAIRTTIALFDLDQEIDVVHRGNPQRVGYEKFLFWGLAIAATDDATWDALAQVRQQHILSRDLDVDVRMGDSEECGR